MNGITGGEWERRGLEWTTAYHLRWLLECENFWSPNLLAFDSCWQWTEMLKTKLIPIFLLFCFFTGDSYLYNIADIVLQEVRQFLEWRRKFYVLFGFLRVLCWWPTTNLSFFGDISFGWIRRWLLLKKMKLWF